MGDSCRYSGKIHYQSYHTLGSSTKPSTRKESHSYRTNSTNSAGVRALRQACIYTYVLLYCGVQKPIFIILHASSWLLQKSFAAKLHPAWQNAFLAFSVPNFLGRPTVSRQHFQGVFSCMNQRIRLYCPCRLRLNSTTCPKYAALELGELSTEWEA